MLLPQLPSEAVEAVLLREAEVPQVSLASSPCQL